MAYARLSLRGWRESGIHKPANPIRESLPDRISSVAGVQPPAFVERWYGQPTSGSTPGHGWFCLTTRLPFVGKSFWIDEEAMRQRVVMVVAVVAVVALVAVAWCGGDTIVNPGSSAVTGISVSGTGRATAEPDLVLLQLGTEVERSTVAAAREDAAASQ